MPREDYAEANEIAVDLGQIGRRTYYLEKDANAIEGSVIRRDHELYEAYKGFYEEFNLLKGQLEQLKETLRRNKVVFNKIVEQFRNAVRKEELEGLNTRISHLEFEKLITKKDLELLRDAV